MAVAETSRDKSNQMHTILTGRAGKKLRRRRMGNRRANSKPDANEAPALRRKRAPLASRSAAAFAEATRTTSPERAAEGWGSREGDRERAATPRQFRSS